MRTSCCAEKLSIVEVREREQVLARERKSGSNQEWEDRSPKTKMTRKLIRSIPAALIEDFDGEIQVCALFSAIVGVQSKEASAAAVQTTELHRRLYDHRMKFDTIAKKCCFSRISILFHSLNRAFHRLS